MIIDFIIEDLLLDSYLQKNFHTPNSTYKIHDSLFALEEGIITPEGSFMARNNTEYPFEAWNTDQTIPSAMTSSVNWYFQTLDEQLGKSGLQAYIQKIGYGNKNLSEELSSYWLESTLKISPVEQVELLTAMYHNSFGFASENIQGESGATGSNANDIIMSILSDLQIAINDSIGISRISVRIRTAFHHLQQ